MYEYGVKVSSVFSVSLLGVEIDLGFGLDRMRISLRLAGVPIREPSMAAKRFVEEWIAQHGAGSALYVRTIKADQMYLGTIFDAHDSRSLNDAINDAVFADG
jgi:hypothetical protein